MLNLLTDVPGLRVGSAVDERLLSGVTVILPDQAAVASVAVTGGAPAGRDLGCLEPDAAVDRIHAIVLAGGSGFGLDAASGAQAWLRENNRGFAVGAVRVPIVPSAICFDLTNGGDKAWGRYPPYRELGHAACVVAADGFFPLGSHGAGIGASTVDLKGGLGSASALTSGGFSVGAIVVVNALGSVLMGAGPHFWAAPLERGDEFGGLGMPPAATSQMTVPTWKGHGRQPSTTLACVATDAVLDKSQARRLAVAASAGLARGLRLSAALMDGDTVFALSTGRQPLSDLPSDIIEIGAIAADCLARAIARAVHAAAVPPAGWAGPPSWRDRFGSPQGIGVPRA